MTTRLLRGGLARDESGRGSRKSVHLRSEFVWCTFAGERAYICVYILQLSHHAPVLGQLRTIKEGVPPSEEDAVPPPPSAPPSEEDVVPPSEEDFLLVEG